MAAAPRARDYVTTVRTRRSVARRSSCGSRRRGGGVASRSSRADGVARRAVVARTLRRRCATLGQAHELEVPLGRRLPRALRRRARARSTDTPRRSVRSRCWRCASKSTGARARDERRRGRGRRVRGARRRARRHASCGAAGASRAPRYEREALRARDAVFAGPALVVEYSSTIARAARVARASSMPTRHLHLVASDAMKRARATRPDRARGAAPSPRGDRRGDGRPARPHRLLAEHQGAARLLVRALRRRGTAGRAGGAHSGAPRLDAALRARGARRVPARAGRRRRAERPVCRRHAPARPDAGRAGACAAAAACSGSSPTARITPTSAA